jgi:hypothetical protein
LSGILLAEAAMAVLTGSEILAKALKKEGTDYLFFQMGGPMLRLPASRKAFVPSTCAMSRPPL